jgi:hypothetical protein
MQGERNVCTPFGRCRAEAAVKQLLLISVPLFLAAALLFHVQLSNVEGWSSRFPVSLTRKRQGVGQGGVRSLLREGDVSVLASYRMQQGRGICGRYLLDTSTARGSFSTVDLIETCKATAGCTHATWNEMTGEWALCSSFEEVKKKEEGWTTAVLNGCHALAPLWPAFVYDSVEEAPFCPQHENTCPVGMHALVEPRPNHALQCDVCPGAGCAVPQSMRLLDGMAEPAHRLARLVGRDMQAFNPLLFHYGGKRYISMRITNQSRCDVDKPKGEVEVHYNSYIGLCEAQLGELRPKEST